MVAARPDNDIADTMIRAAAPDRVSPDRALGSETVEVRHRGAVDLATFECRDINRSSLIQRVCYDQAQRHLVVGISGNYEDFCELPPQAFAGFMTAPSMGKFFKENIRAAGRPLWLPDSRPRPLDPRFSPSASRRR